MRVRLHANRSQGKKRASYLAELAESLFQVSIFNTRAETGNMKVVSRVDTPVSASALRSGTTGQQEAI